MSPHVILRGEISVIGVDELDAAIRRRQALEGLAQTTTGPDEERRAVHRHRPLRPLTPPGDPTMSTIAPSTTPLARSTDPATSDKAAESLNPTHVGAQMDAILEILRDHPAGLDDHGIARIYFRHAADRGWPMTFQDSVRKRRSQLTRDGHVVPVGTHTNEHTGREMTLWAVAR